MYKNIMAGFFTVLILSWPMLVAADDVFNGAFTPGVHLDHETYLGPGGEFTISYDELNHLYRMHFSLSPLDGGNEPIQMMAVSTKIDVGSIVFTAINSENEMPNFKATVGVADMDIEGFCGECIGSIAGDGNYRIAIPYLEFKAMLDKMLVVCREAADLRSEFDEE